MGDITCDAKSGESPRATPCLPGKGNVLRGTRPGAYYRAEHSPVGTSTRGESTITLHHQLARQARSLRSNAEYFEALNRRTYVTR